MQYTKIQSFALVTMRLAIGWHFLYEGGVKLLNPHWTSKSYLMDSGGFMKGIFSYIADNHTLLNISDAANAWGLTLIGLALMLGLFARYASLAGIFLLLLYYLSHPAFPGIDFMFPSDGSYFIINKTLVELFAMLVIFAFPSLGQFGIERFIHKKQQ